MKSTFKAAIFALTLAVCPHVHAAPLTDADQIGLQVVMQQYIDANTINDGLMQVDAAEAKINTFYPTKAHPKIMAWGDNIIMCADFQDASGKTVMGNFYMTKSNGKYVVFQATFGPDVALDKLMKTGKAVMAN